MSVPLERKGKLNKDAVPFWDTVYQEQRGDRNGHPLVLEYMERYCECPLEAELLEPLLYFCLATAHLMAVDAETLGDGSVREGGFYVAHAIAES